MYAPINKIIHHSVVDGPGNRTAIFFQGCNFDCAYCHNPETIALCQNCMTCLPACPVGALTQREGKVTWNPALCVSCDGCIAACPHQSSPKVTHMTPQEVADLVAVNAPFIRGVTCSGGECTLYPDFLVDLFTRTKAMGLENLLDSNGSYPYLENEALMAVTDGVMLDIKAYDDEIHRHLTGRSNKPVLENAVALAKIGKLPEIRTVIIPQVLPNEEGVEAICKLLAPYLSIAPIRYKLLRFRPMGVREEYRSWPTPGDALMNRLAALVQSHGFTDVVIL